MKLNEIVWPVYQIRTHDKLWEDNGIMYIDTYSYNYIIDNKNLKGDTLGQRRVRINKEVLLDRKLYPLNKAYYTLREIIVNRHQSKVYIDSLGNLLRYKKSRVAKLIYRKIEKIEVTRSGMLVHCEGIYSPRYLDFIHPIYLNKKYIGLLHIDNDYIVYEFSDELKNTTWRKV